MPTALTDGLAIPPPTLLSGDIGVIVSLPAATLLSGDIGALLTAPAITLSSTVIMNGSLLTAPAVLLTATGIVGPYTSIEVPLPVPTLTGTARTSLVMSLAEVLPLPSLSASARVNVLAAVNAALPPPLAGIMGFAGATVSVVIAVPAPTLSAAGYPTYTADVAIIVPAAQLTAFLTAPVTAAYNTWVLNTRRNALTSYGPEFQFNSYALFNGVVLGCGPSGVVVLGTQASDNGTAIDAIARTGKSDYDRSLLKRVPRLYIDYSTDGDMIFRTITSESGTRSYLLPTNNVIGFQQRRVPIGKGPKAAYWQYEMENVAGADFTTRGIMAYPVMLRRWIM